MAMLTGRPARLKLNRSKRCIETEMVELTGDRVFDRLGGAVRSYHAIEHDDYV